MKLQDITENNKDKETAMYHFLEMIGDVANRHGDEAMYNKYALPDLEKLKDMGVSADTLKKYTIEHVKGDTGWTSTDIYWIDVLDKKVYGHEIFDDDDDDLGLPSEEDSFDEYRK